MTRTQDRKVELDWLRLGIVGAVFLFHTCRFFDPEGWHVKSATLHPWLRYPIMVFAAFSMPLLFVVSGSGVRFALHRRGAVRFLRDRVLRLLVPLVVGVLTHVMVQVYLERLSHGQFHGSLLAFVPRYFEGWYGFGGSFAWSGFHLWYLEVLFGLSLAFLPLFLWFETATGARALDRLCALLARPGGIYLLAVPVALGLVLPHATSVLGARWWGGWNLVGHACFLVSGYLFASSEALYDRVRQLRGWSLAGFVAVAVPVVLAFPASGDPAHGSLQAWLLLGGMAFASWCAVLGVLGVAIAELRRVKLPFLGVASEAVLPCYALHQSVIVVVGWGVLRLGLPDLAAWAVIFSASLAATVAGYAFLIRPFPIVRVLFGMKARPLQLPSPGAQGSSASPAPMAAPPSTSQLELSR